MDVKHGLPAGGPAVLKKIQTCCASGLHHSTGKAWQMGGNCGERLGRQIAQIAMMVIAVIVILGLVLATVAAPVVN